MARKFFSFLGKGTYKECIYFFEDSEKTTKYIQEALVNIFCSEWNEEDEVIIFTTNCAKSTHWYNENDKDSRLKERLNNAGLKVKIKNVYVPDGKNEKEIWDIFDIILKEINNNDEIIFDITHGYRSLPMLTLVILNYAKVLKNIKLLGIYYGAFEEKKEERVPIFDLTSFDELLEWGQAVNTFVKYGNSSHLTDLSYDIINNKYDKISESSKLMKNFVTKLNDFTNCIYTCRGQIVDCKKGRDQKSVYNAYSKMKMNLDKIIKEDKCTLKPLVPLLDKIDKETNEFDKEDNLCVGMAIIKWSIKNNLIQQAYTALDETIKTYVCKKCNFNEGNKEYREDIVNTAINIKANKAQKGQWKITDKVPDAKEKINYVMDNIEDELCKISKKVKKFRNDINHFGFNNDALGYNKLKDEIQKLYSEFENYIINNPIN